MRFSFCPAIGREVRCCRKAGKEHSDSLSTPNVPVSAEEQIDIDLKEREHKVGSIEG